MKKYTRTHRHAFFDVRSVRDAWLKRYVDAPDVWSGWAMMNDLFLLAYRYTLHYGHSYSGGMTN